MRRVVLALFALVLLTLAALAVITAVAVGRIESAVPPAGEFIDVDGVRLHYTDRGAGPAVVLIHGASSNLLEFQHSLVPLLARDHRVLAFDRPGHGHSEAAAGGGWMDPAMLADLLLTASETLGAPRPLLVGHSWSGSVVMSALVREPDRVAGGVLLAGAAGHWVGERSAVERLRDWPWLNALFAHTLVVPVGSQLIPTVLESVFAPHPVPPGHAERVGARLALRPSSYLANAEDLERLAPFLQRESTRYDEIARPLLVIHGTADTIVPFWNHGERLQPVVTGLQAMLMEGHGHALYHVAPAEVAQGIATFALGLQR